MRVLIISHTYISPINRKKWQVLATLYPDTNLTVVFPSIWPTTIFNHKAEIDLQSFNLENCKFISLDVYKAGNEVLYCYRPIKLLNLIKEIKPGIIHVEQGDNALSYFQTIMTSKVIRLKPKFVFFTWVNWHHKFSLKYRIFWKRIENFNLKHSDAAVTGNAPAKEILIGKGFKKPVLVLPQLGVDTQIFKPAEKRHTETIKIGFVGRLVEEKGIFLLLQAFSLLFKDFSNLKLSFLGQGAYKEKLAQQINRFNLEDCVEIIEPVPHEHVVKFMQSLNIFILPSIDIPEWKEQFGHVLIEAMACKIAVIGSDAGEIPNVLDGAGEVFKQNNVQALFNTLKKLITDNNYRNKLAEDGYKKVIREYSCEAIASKTHNFWAHIREKGELL